MATPHRCWVTPARAPCEWEARTAESQGISDGEVYYVNVLSGESVWEKPDDFDESLAEVESKDN